MVLLAKSLLALGLLFTANSLSASVSGYLTIIHFDVGQGDATLIRGTNGKTILIDAGRSSSARNNIVPDLKSMGIDRLDYVVISHFDSDHIGGVPALQEFIQADTIICDRGKVAPIGKFSNVSFNKYWDLANLSRHCALDVGALDWDLGDDIDLGVYSVNGRVLGGPTVSVGKDENAASVGLKLSYGGFDYIVSGDLTGGGAGKPNVEEPFGHAVGNVDVMRLNHHGSHTSSNKSMVKIVKAEVGIISVGAGGYAKKYSHPRKVVIEAVVGTDADVPVKALYMTNAGHPDEALSPIAKSRTHVAHGNVVIWAAKDHYFVNGRIFKTDDRE